MWIGRHQIRSCFNLTVRTLAIPHTHPNPITTYRLVKTDNYADMSFNRILVAQK